MFRFLAWGPCWSESEHIRATRISHFPVKNKIIKSGPGSEPSLLPSSGVIGSMFLPQCSTCHQQQPPSAPSGPPAPGSPWAWERRRSLSTAESESKFSKHSSQSNPVSAASLGGTAATCPWEESPSPCQAGQQEGEAQVLKGPEPQRGVPGATRQA